MRDEDEFEAAYRDRWLARAREGRRRPPPLLHAPRARFRPGVHRRDDHGAARRRRVGAAGASGSRTATCGRGRATSTSCVTTCRARSCCRCRGRRSPVADLDAVPTEPRATTTSRCSWRTPRGRTRGCSTTTSRRRTTQYAPSLAEGRHGGRSMLELLSVWQTAFGTGRRAEVVLWQRVTEPKRLLGLLYTEIPAEHRAPGTWMHDALPRPRRLGEPPPPHHQLVPPLLTQPNHWCVSHLVIPGSETHDRGCGPAFLTLA